MSTREKRNEIALISCIELVLMSKGNTKYNLVVAKLNSLYNITIRDCYKHPKYLQIVLKDVYKEDYNSIINEIKLHLDDIANEKELAEFFEIVES